MADEFEHPGFVRAAAVRVGWFLFLGIPLMFAAWSWISLNFVYSRGERAGYIQKISKRGWVFKTWEGELAMANLPGTLPQIFDFTVRDGSVAQQMEKSIGQRASITYDQHRGLPGTIFGETEYFVTKIVPVADPYQLHTQDTPAPPAAK